MLITLVPAFDSVTQITSSAEAKDLDIRVDGSRLVIQGKLETTNEQKDEDGTNSSDSRSPG